MLKNSMKGAKGILVLVVAVISLIISSITKNPVVKGTLSGGVIFLLLISFFISIEYKNILNPGVRGMYNIDLKGEYKATMHYETFSNDNSKGKVKCFKDKKEVELVFEIAGNRLHMNQTTNQASSIARLVTIKKINSKEKLYIFEYNTSPKLSNDIKVPQHDGIMRITVVNGIIKKMDYMNKKPGHGGYDNIKKIN